MPIGGVGALRVDVENTCGASGRDAKSSTSSSILDSESSHLQFTTILQEGSLLSLANLPKYYCKEQLVTISVFDDMFD